MMAGLWQHFLLTLRLNFRSGRAIAYGYGMPVLFLLGFGGVFRSGEPLLLGQMGQILTITILGGACLGMPTTLVAERERGVWQRFRLLPLSVNWLLFNVLLVRIVIVGLAILLQLVLARLIYGTPFPAHLPAFVAAVLLASGAFLGLGLIITALAHDVPAVQALGQCLFLPMILIGGVGVPLVVLPEWAQVLASFMPGRYSVELLQASIEGGGWREGGFAVAALFVIGLTGGMAGLKLLRWESESRLPARSWAWVGGALAAWLLVGIVAFAAGRMAAVEPGTMARLEEITEADLAGIRYERLPDDNGFYAPLAPPLDGQRLPHRMQEFLPRLEEWGPGKGRAVGQNVRNLLSVAAVADITQDTGERLIARAVYEQLLRQFEERELERALAWVVLNPQAGRVLTEAPELGISGRADAEIVRERSGWYARKFLGRIRGEIED